MFRFHIELWDDKNNTILQQLDSFVVDESTAREVFNQAHTFAHYTRFGDDEKIEARVVTPHRPRNVKRERIEGLVTPKVPSHIEAEEKMRKGGLDEFGIDE